MSCVFWACVGPVFWFSGVWTFLMPVSSVSKDSGCRVSSQVSACVISACGFMFGIITSSSCSSRSEVGEVLVDLIVPSTVSLRDFLCCSSMSFMTLQGKVLVGILLCLNWFPVLLMRGIMTVVVCLESPVEKGIHLVHYPWFVHCLVARKWVCL